jgi:hypothetical protein
MTGLLLIFQYAPTIPPSFLKSPINENCWLDSEFIA